MAEEFRPDNGDETLRYLQTEIDALPVPDFNGADATEHGIELQLTVDDYNQAPEEALSKIAYSSSVVSTISGEIRWQGQGMYQGSLLARLIRPGNGPKHVLVSGSIYVPPSRAEMLQSDEYEELLSQASQSKAVIPGLTGRFSPAVIAPGVICKDAMPYYRVARPVAELDFSDALMQESSLRDPVHGSFISLERSAGTVHTYFVYEKLFIFPAITALYRKYNGEYFTRFE